MMERQRGQLNKFFNRVSLLLGGNNIPLEGLNKLFTKGFAPFFYFFKLVRRETGSSKPGVPCRKGSKRRFYRKINKQRTNKSE